MQLVMAASRKYKYAWRSGLGSSFRGTLAHATDACGGREQRTISVHHRIYIRPWNPERSTTEERANDYCILHI